MPAKKTTKNKKVTSKSKQNWLKSKINFKSRKTQLLFTVLTFAVIGGAYFTYKSFASTAMAYYNPTDYSHTHGSAIVNDSIVVNGNKQSISTIKINPGGNIYSSKGVRPPVGYTWRLCASVRGLGTFSIGALVKPNNINFGEIKNANDAVNYKTYCTSYKDFGSNDPYVNAPRIENKNGWVLKDPYIYVQKTWIESGQSSAPQEVPAKN